MEHGPVDHAIGQNPAVQPPLAYLSYSHWWSSPSAGEAHFITVFPKNSWRLPVWPPCHLGAAYRYFNRATIRIANTAAIAPNTAAWDSFTAKARPCVVTSTRTCAPNTPRLSRPAFATSAGFCLRRSVIPKTPPFFILAPRHWFGLLIKCSWLWWNVRFYFMRRRSTLAAFASRHIERVELVNTNSCRSNDSSDAALLILCL